MIPELNKTYNYFDDGKIRESRRDDAEITAIIPLNDIDEITFEEWKEDVRNCHWLYKKETDFFIKAHLKEVDVDVVFVRTIEDDWFSLGWWAGRLDIDGSLLELMKKNKTFR